MDGSSRIGTGWSDLPQELVEKIASCLDTETDVLRFRAICSSWRSWTVPSKTFPCTPLKLPLFGSSHRRLEGPYFSLTERTVYRVQLPESTEPRFWVVKTERSRDGKLRILNPVSNHQVKIMPETQLPKLLNTLDFRVSEVCKGYDLRYVDPAHSKRHDEYDYGYAKKVVVTGDVKNDEYVIMALDINYKLWYIKSGDEKWTVASDKWKSFGPLVDVVNHKGHIYVTDRYGGTWVFDSMFEFTNITDVVGCNVPNCQLVELYNGELFLVEEVPGYPNRVGICYIYDGADDGYQYRCNRSSVRKVGVEIRISRIDKQSKKWVDAKTVGNHIIFLGDDCSFSVPAEEFEGCKGTRFFYPNFYFCFGTEEEKPQHYDCDSDDGYFVCNFVPSDEVKLKFRGLNGHNTGVCDFATGKTGSLLMFPEYAHIFWPPPSWLSRS
ncbi:hypothetical protein Salat_1092000 [Sesamum alatum]|uniref:F-box domain-containing protein n=1 Tax=Sesamum alatum TaxID=300844 RepID=A0AAE1YNK1_9LAMI|nr:hypothetical protein Salat_1092000 [Sesamum alatum]